MSRSLIVLLIAAVSILFLAGAIWIVSGRGAGPAIEILHPVDTVGAADRLDVAIDAPGGRLTSLEVVFEQDDRQTSLFSLASVGSATLQQETAERVRLSRSLGRSDLPGLKPGAARVIVRASRPALFGLRQIESVAARTVDVRLDPPRLTIVSMHHYLNHGGAEFVVYRVTPPDSASGVLVGDVEFPGYPASGARVEGVSISDPSLKVAFFALLYDQDLDTSIEVFARDQAGNVARTPLDHQTFPRPFGRSRVTLDDAFLSRVVPPILSRAPELGQSGDDRLAAYLAINGELRRRNDEQIAALASRTSPDLLWGRPFEQLAGSKVEASFADHRTYFYRGREVDRQVHLGLDLATTAAAPVFASNRGTVVFAEYLGIYGNTVIIDHGMGVQSLYAHLSSIGVQVGATVEQGQPLGRSGQTGLAGGDHLHFTMLVHGHMVSPVEWWDPHWIEDRIIRKLRDAAR